VIFRAGKYRLSGSGASQIPLPRDQYQAILDPLGGRAARCRAAVRPGNTLVSHLT
jgi:hypothetical protein